MSSNATADAPKLDGVEREHGARAERADEDAAERRTDHAQGDRPDELVERVRLRELVLGHEVGNDGVERGREERLARAVDGDEDRDVPDLERARRR